MTDEVILVFTSLAVFSYLLLSILSFLKAHEHVVYLWLGLLYLAPLFAFLDNFLIYQKAGINLLFHLSVFINLSSGAFLILIIKNLSHRKKAFFSFWLFLPSLFYLPFLIYCFFSPLNLSELINRQTPHFTYIAVTIYNVLIVMYTVCANLYMLYQELIVQKSSPYRKIRVEILAVMLTLQLLAFIPYIFQLNIIYSIIYMPLFGQIFFVYVFFRLIPRKASFLNPIMDVKYHGIKISEEQKGELRNRILELMHVKRLYLKEECDLHMLSNELQASPHIISMCINSNFNKSFPDFINSFRVKSAIELLQSENNHYSIEGIAFLCGFGNRTSFYKTFKKETGRLPSEFLRPYKKKISTNGKAFMIL